MLSTEQDRKLKLHENNYLKLEQQTKARANEIYRIRRFDDREFYNRIDQFKKDKLWFRLFILFLIITMISGAMVAATENVIAGLTFGSSILLAIISIVRHVILNQDRRRDIKLQILKENGFKESDYYNDCEED